LIKIEKSGQHTPSNAIFFIYDKITCQINSPWMADMMTLKNKKYRVIRFVLVIVTTFFYAIAYAQPIVGQFFGIWDNHNQHWQQKFRSDTPFDKLNRLYIAFGKIVKTNGHFTIAFDGSADHVQQLIERVQTQNPTADIFLTVGGDGGAQSYGGAANDPDFAENVLSFLNEYGFNGLDIDWENSLNQANLDQLVKNVYATLHANHKKLTLDVWPFPVSAYDMPVLKNNLDQINIMSYGTGLALSDCATAFSNAGFPLNQMIGGIETELGYDQFGGTTDTLGASGTIAQKANYALQNNMAGMMSWRLDNDYATTDHPNTPTYQGALQLWNTLFPSSQH